MTATYLFLPYIWSNLPYMYSGVLVTPLERMEDVLQGNYFKLDTRRSWKDR
jgi:hypothetical protein